VLDLAEAQPLCGEDEQSRQLIKEAEAWHDITVGRFQGYAEGVKDLGRRGSDTLTAAVALSEAENGESRAERFGAFHLEYLMMKAPIEKIEDDLAQDKVPAPIMIRGQKVLAAYDELKSLVDDVADDELPLDEKVAQDIADCAVALQDAQKEAYKAFAHEVDAFSVGGAASSAVTRGLATTAGAGSQQLAAATS
jgi:hypothetical protein